MGLFTGIEEATSSAGGNYIKPGRHLLKIVVNRPKKSRKKKDLAISEFEVLESTAHDEGESVSWAVNLTDHDAAIGNIKGYLAAVAECEEDEVDEAGAERAYSAENPFEGMTVALETFMIKTRAGGAFTKHVWKPASEWAGLNKERAAAAEEETDAA